jgi:hypothetical protein
VLLLITLPLLNLLGFLMPSLAARLRTLWAWSLFFTLVLGASTLVSHAALGPLRIRALGFAVRLRLDTRRPFPRRHRGGFR